MMNLWYATRHALKYLGHHGGLAARVILTLAIGIGSTTAVFSAINAILLAPLGFPQSHQLVRVFSTSPDRGWYRMTSSFPDYADWSERGSAFSAMGAFQIGAATLLRDLEPERIRIIKASASLLPTLDVSPQLGRSVAPEEDRPNAPASVMFSYSAWQRLYGADSTLIGRVVYLDDIAHEVVGILPATLEESWGQFDGWVPLRMGITTAPRGNRSLHVMARLADGHTLAEAQMQLGAIAASLAEEHPETNRGISATAVLLSDLAVSGTARRALAALALAVAFVLLIACANVTYLLLADATTREREFALCAAVGATPMDLVRQSALHSLILALLGGGLGILVALWGVKILAIGLAGALGQTYPLVVDSRALAFALGLAILTGLTVGVLPTTRLARPDLAVVINEGSRSVTTGRRGRARRTFLVVGQVALAFALLVSSLLMVRSLLALRAIAPGFDPSGVLMAQVRLPETRYPNDASRARFFDAVMQRLDEAPSIAQAAAVSAATVPLIGGSNAAVAIEGYSSTEHVFVGDGIVTPGYFSALGIPLLRGRTLTRDDVAGREGVVIVNEALASSFWPGDAALGKRIKFGGVDSDNPWLTVVGVVGNVRQLGLTEPIRPETYRPFAQEAWPDMTMVVRAEADPQHVARVVRDAVWEVDPALAVFGIQPFKELVAGSYQAAGSLAIMLGFLGALAVILACIGLYTIIAYSAAQRTREIGVRVALGADARLVIRMLLRQAALLTAAGLVAGLLMATVLGRVLRASLYGVQPMDPLTFATAGIALFVVAIGAAYMPARRATRIEPTAALRAE